MFPSYFKSFLVCFVGVKGGSTFSDVEQVGVQLSNLLIVLGLRLLYCYTTTVDIVLVLAVI